MRYAHCDVVLCDADPVIAGVWEYLIGVSPREIRRIPDLPVDGTINDPKILDQAKALVGFWLNRASAAPLRSPAQWMRTGICPGSQSSAVVPRTPGAA